MSWSRSAGAAAVSADVTGAVAVQAGDLIIAIGGAETAADNTTVTDNAAGGSNAYTQIGTKLSSAFMANWFWAIAKATETLTITISGGDGVSTDLALVAIFRNSIGPLTGTPLRGSAQQSHAGSLLTDGVTSTALAGTVAGDLIVSLCVVLQTVPGTGIFTAGTNFTEDAAAQNDQGSGVCGAIEYELNGAGGSIAGTWTWGQSHTYGCAVAAFKTPAAAGAVMAFQSGFLSPVTPGYL